MENLKDNLFKNLHLLCYVACKVADGELSLPDDKITEKSCCRKKSAREDETIDDAKEVNKEIPKAKKLKLVYRGKDVLYHTFVQESSLPNNNNNNGSPKKKQCKKKTSNKKPRRAKAKLSMQFMELKEKEPAMPEELKNKIEEASGGSSSFSCILMKQLCYTDVSDSHARLLIPKGQINGDFLTPEEDMNAENQGISVPVIDPSLNDSSVQLKKWKMNSVVYALVKGWKKLKNANDLKEGDIIQIWSFRKVSELNFAIVKIPTNDATPPIALEESAAASTNNIKDQNSLV